ncbi:MAG: DNRLRE domain-containing protein [Planctomycetota bacterium]|nr:DNRLRE domain-containing protein [Planctomycetota bacterium]
MSSLLRLALLSAVAGLVHADVDVFVPDQDNTLYAESDGLSNGKGIYVFAGVNGQGSARRAVLRFDLACLPDGAVVDAARLRLVVGPTSVGDRQVDLHRVIRSWGEGDSLAQGNGGGGADATDGDATWGHRFYPSLGWSSAGGDFDATPTTVALAGASGAELVFGGVGLVADLQSWISDPSSNHGWLLRQPDEVTPSTAKALSSREHTSVANRPWLEVTYHVPGSCVGVAHCVANPNSTGAPANLSVGGSCSLADGLFSLTACPVPEQPVLFFHGPSPDQQPLGDGFLCVSGPHVRILPPVFASGQVATVTIDPAAHGILAAGTVHFQAWYRDPDAGGAGSNTTDAVAVTFML